MSTSNNPDDLLTPGTEIEVSPDTAEELGAFEEQALTEQEAKDSVPPHPSVQESP